MTTTDLIARLNQALMNLQPKISAPARGTAGPGDAVALAYCEGHRDARHAAAEVAMEIVRQCADERVERCVAFGTTTGSRCILSADHAGEHRLEAAPDLSELEAKARAATDDEAVCYCGMLMSDHHEGSSCTNAIEMPQPQNWCIVFKLRNSDVVQMTSNVASEDIARKMRAAMVERGDTVVAIVSERSLLAALRNYQARAEAADKQSYDDLAASGGIVEAP